MNPLTNFQRTIIEATGCETEDAPVIETYMKDIVNYVPLNTLKVSQFCEAAKKAYSDILWVRSQNWTEYMNLLN